MQAENLMCKPAAESIFTNRHLVWMVGLTHPRRASIRLTMPLAHYN